MSCAKDIVQIQTSKGTANWWYWDKYEADGKTQTANTHQQF